MTLNVIIQNEEQTLLKRHELKIGQFVFVNYFVFIWAKSQAINIESLYSYQTTSSSKLNGND